MRKKILLVLTSSFCLLCFVVANSAGAEDKGFEESQAQQDRLLRINKYISHRRREIERFYSDRIADLQMLARAEIANLEIVEKIGYTALTEWAQLTAAAEVLKINSYQHQSFGYYESENRPVPNRLKLAQKQVKRLVAARSKIAELINNVQSHLEWELINLQRQQNYALNVELPALERRLKQSQPEPASAVTKGVLTGILFSRDNPAAIIDGIVVHRSQQLKGVEIIEIHPDRVEFEKAGRRWQQKVRAEPSEFWQ